MIDHRRHGKANHEAPTRRHPSTLVALRIRNETSDISMESDEGHDCRWTYPYGLCKCQFRCKVHRYLVYFTPFGVKYIDFKIALI